MAGYSMDKVHKILKKSPINDITIVVRDRPFERTITMHKDSTGHIGFQFSNGKITSIVKDSSAARNGLLIEHQLLEVNGQNVVGMRDKAITEIILNEKEPVITITIIPSFIYDHMVKKYVICRVNFQLRTIHNFRIFVVADCRCHSYAALWIILCPLISNRNEDIRYQRNTSDFISFKPVNCAVYAENLHQSYGAIFIANH